MRFKIIDVTETDRPSLTLIAVAERPTSSGPIPRVGDAFDLGESDDDDPPYAKKVG